MTLNFSILLYLVATGLLIRQWLTAQDKKAHLAQYFVIAAVIFHGIALYSIIITNQGMDIGFFSALSFTAWLMATLLVVASFSLPVGSLGLLVYPFALISLVLRATSDTQNILTDQLTAGLEAHILFSVLAYSLLSISVAQAILLYIQDKYLHNKHPSGFLRRLPSLETMEILLFRIIGLGVIALSISLLSGFLYLDDMFAQSLAHKTVLSLFAWSVFVGLLWGHHKFGWRGKTAIKWSISGFTLLMLAYFGSKFVIELVLKQ